MLDLPGVNADHGVYARLQSHGYEAGSKVLCSQQNLLVGQPLWVGIIVTRQSFLLGAIGV